MSLSTTFHYQRDINLFRVKKIKPLFRFLTILISILFLGLPATVCAQTIIYTGDAGNLGQAPWLFSVPENVLFPGTSAAPLSSDNRIVIYYLPGTSGTANPGHVFGGVSHRQSVTGNRVEMINGLVDRSVWGGFTVDGNAAYNAVTMSGGTVNEDIRGGASFTGNATYNAVTMSGGTVNAEIRGGSSNTGDSAYNTVTMSGGTVVLNVMGGASNSPESKGKVEHNSVFISGGTVGTNLYGGWSLRGAASNNMVTMGGGVVSGDIIGGFGSLGGNAEYNSVTISGGVVSGDIIGGMSVSGVVSGDIIGGMSVSADATHNTVTIEGSPILANANITGGVASGDKFTGNTLNFKSSNVSAGGVSNFEYYNFYLPAGTGANDNMLTITEAADLKGATAKIYMQDKTALQVGDRVSLIRSGSGVTNYTANSSKIAWGAFLIYDFNIYAETNALWAELDSVSTSSSNRALTNARLAPLSFLNQGADMTEPLSRMETTSDDRYTAFAMVGGGSSTYDTGSGVEVKGASLLAGATWDANISKNNLTIGAFIETGWGSYNTDNSFGSVSVKGSGDMDYYGGGLYARHLWDSGFYADASLRGGRVATDFDSSNLDVSGTLFSYDSSSTYYGAHAGIGYNWNLNAKNRLEVSGKYTWTHLNSSEFTSSGGDEISFDSTDSYRLRAGFRIYHDYGKANAVTLYYGAAYEYEFDGDTGGRLYGTYALDGSSLSGGVGIGELGVMFNPSKNNDRLMMQLGVQGYVGTREGVSGSLKLQYAF